MRVSVVDKMEISDRRKTVDGYLATNARIARTGIYEYAGRDLGRPEIPVVSVYRDEDVVFSEASLASFAHKPVTLNHPPYNVTAKNWKDYAVGQVGGKIKRDGEYVEVPMVVQDQRAIDAIDSGTQELSAGYAVDIEFIDGLTPDGKPYQARMVGEIQGNHVAIVKNGRAGSSCRIGDAWPTETNPPKKEPPKMATYLYDGVKVDLSDEEATLSLVNKLKGIADKANTDAVAAAKALTDAEATHASALKDANDAKDKAEAEVVSAKKALEDAKVTPEQLRDAAKAYAMVIDAAGKIAPAFKIADTMSEAEIRKGVVLAKFGDGYASKSESFFDALFEVESAKVKDAKPVNPTDPFRSAMSDRQIPAADARAEAEKARNEMIDGFKREAA